MKSSGILIIVINFLSIVYGCNNNSSNTNNSDDTTTQNIIESTVFDTMAKCSCLLLKTDKNSNPEHLNGTGFLIRYKNEVYLISAYHIFFSSRLEGGFDSIIGHKLICRYLKTNNVFSYDTIDLDPLLKGIKEPESFFDRPDVFAYNLGAIQNVYTINSFLVSDTTFIENNVETCTYGYPNNAISKFGWYPTLLKGKTQAASNQPAMNVNGKVLNYFATNPFPGYNEAEGRSGAPVFFIGKDNKWHFYGVFVGGAAEADLCMITKFSDVYKAISNTYSFSNFIISKP